MMGNLLEFCHESMCFVRLRNAMLKVWRDSSKYFYFLLFFSLLSVYNLIKAARFCRRKGIGS